MSHLATDTSRQGPSVGRALLLPATLLVAVAAVIGAGVGRLWWLWWSPGFTGRIYDTTAGPMWLPEPFDPGFADSFTGTAQYVALGAGAGVLLGLIGAVLLRRAAVPGVAVVVLASLVAAGVALVVGTMPSPPDPQTYATAAQVGTEHEANLEVSGWTPYLVWPVGALLGYAVFMVLTAGASDLRGRHQDPNWLSVTADRPEPTPRP